MVLELMSIVIQLCDGHGCQRLYVFVHGLDAYMM